MKLKFENAVVAAPLEDTPEWCRFSLPPQLYSDPIELEGTRLHATELLGFSDISFQSIPFTGTSPRQLLRII